MWYIFHKKNTILLIIVIKIVITILFNLSIEVIKKILNKIELMNE